MLWKRHGSAHARCFRTQFGLKPLHYAALNGFEEQLKELLERGALIDSLSLVRLRRCSGAGCSGAAAVAPAPRC